jgi:mannose-6-phosphate isomerase-like protein (cupin superfamily)
MPARRSAAGTRELSGHHRTAYRRIWKEAVDQEFETMKLPTAPDVIAPDGSDVRILLGLKGGGMAHFELGPHRTSRAIAHRSVDEIWYVLSGAGEMWLKTGNHQETVPLTPGVCLSIPVGTHFQFRSSGPDPLAALGVTMPPWPGEDEAFEVTGPWTPDAETNKST